jgi:hypothetical protein
MKLDITLVFASVVATAAVANADHRTPRPAAPPPGRTAGARAIGAHIVPHPDQPPHPINNPPHQVIIHDPKANRDEHHDVIVDHRPPQVIDRDPRLRVVVRGYHSSRDWTRFHRPRGGWWKLWGIAAWDTVGTVTCEAANEISGELFPVSMDRDARGWDDDSVNAILDQALDDCMTESDGGGCIAATPPCTFQPY